MLFLFSFFPIHGFSQFSYPGTNGEWTQDYYRSDEFFNGIHPLRWDRVVWDCQFRGVLGVENNTYTQNGIAYVEFKKENVIGTNSYCQGNQYGYSMGALMSRFQVGKNTFIEIKAKLADYRANLISALWLSDKPVHEKNPNLEFDIVETLNQDNRRVITSTLHWRIKDSNENTINHGSAGKDIELSNPPSDGFHIYGLERNEGIVKFYFDRNLIWEIEETELEDMNHYGDDFDSQYLPFFRIQNRKIIITLGRFSNLAPNDNYLPAKLEVDYVRTFTKKDPTGNLILSGPHVICPNNSYSLITLSPMPENPSNLPTYNWGNYMSNPYWMVSGNLIADIPNSNLPQQLAVKVANPNMQGIGAVTATVDGVSVVKIMWTGTPSFTTQLTPDYNYVYASLFPGSQYNFSKYGLNNITWQKLSSTNNGTGSGSGLSGVFHGPNYNWTVTERITASNSCGSKSIEQLIVSQPCPPELKINNLDNNSYVVERIIPCPTLGNKNNGLSITSIIINVYDLNGNVKKKISNNTIINLDDLPKGLYIVQAVADGEIVSKQVIAR